MDTPRLGFYVIPDTGASVPVFATEGSACFDIKAQFHADESDGKKPVVMYGPQNVKMEFVPSGDCIEVPVGWRALIPTGLIMDIPDGYSVRLHARSGAALKTGLVLANSEGVIDSDYTHELMVMVTAIGSPVSISHGDRICQAELVKNQPVAMGQILFPPQKKTDRDGGFGSTGV